MRKHVTKLKTIHATGTGLAASLNKSSHKSPHATLLIQIHPTNCTKHPTHILVHKYRGGWKCVFTVTIHAKIMLILLFMSVISQDLMRLLVVAYIMGSVKIDALTLG
jgi:hypothetical protein